MQKIKVIHKVRKTQQQNPEFGHTQGEIQKKPAKKIKPVEYAETYYETQSKVEDEPKEKEKNSKLTLSDLNNDNPHNIPAQMLQDWMTNRKTKKSPVTPTVWNSISTELYKCTDPIKAFEEMVCRGWLSLKADWVDKIVTARDQKQVNGAKSSLDFKDKSWADDLDLSMCFK